MTDDLRAHVRAAISARATLRGIDTDPARSETVTGRLDDFTDAALSALGDGAQWLMMQAEQYQQRAHTAEKALAVPAKSRPPARWDYLIAAPCALIAGGVAILVQWAGVSSAVANGCAIASLAVTLPVAGRIESRWRRARGAGAR